MKILTSLYPSHWLAIATAVDFCSWLCKLIENVSFPKETRMCHRNPQISAISPSENVQNCSVYFGKRKSLNSLDYNDLN